MPLPGGDASVHRPYRMALAHLRAAGVAVGTPDLPAGARPARRRSAACCAHQLDTGLGCVPTSSMGRLFDAVASLAGVRHVVDYEAEAAIELEGLARAARRRRRAVRVRRSFATPADGPCWPMPAPVVRAVAADVRAAGIAGVDRRPVPRAPCATLVVDLAGACRDATPAWTRWRWAAGSSRTRCCSTARGRACASDGFTVLRPQPLPPNDGGIALGQVLVGRRADRDSG